MLAAMSHKALLVLECMLVAVVMGACSGGTQTADSPAPEAKVEVELSPTEESRKPEPTKPHTPYKIAPPTTPTQVSHALPTTPSKTAELTSTSTQSSDLTQIAQPTEFVSSKDYGEFDIGLRIQFQAAVDNEFSTLEEKAGISVAVYTDGTVSYTHLTLPTNREV